MSIKNFTIKTLLFVLISSIIYNISNHYIKKEEKSQLRQKYQTITTHMKKNLSTLIKDKKNATLAVAILAAKDTNLKKALLSNNNSNINLQTFSLELRKKTEFKNVWFQILDKEGKSFYRSWTKDSKDSLTFRPDVVNILKEKQVQTSISVGRYDMTFKSMVPIFHKGELLGIFEVITHFNSISRILELDRVDSVIFAHKKYKNKIKYPFTKKFLGDYYIANLNAKDYLIELIEKEGLEELLKTKNYTVINENLLTTYEIIELDKKTIGYVFLAKKIKDIDISSIKIFKKNSLFYVFFSIIIFAILFTAINYFFYLKKIKLQEKKNQTILDSQKNIILITDGRNLKNANRQLLEFFDIYSSLKEFKKDYACVCETFKDINDSDYVTNIDYDGRNWAEYILDNPNKKFKAAIEKNNILHHFVLNVTLTQFAGENDPYIIVTLTDISHEMEQNEKLKSLNDNLELLVDTKTKELKQLNESLEEKVLLEISKSKEKDRLLFQQNKMAAMGEMLSNIAHQWRQPLSSISTAASGMQLRRELNVLTQEEIADSCEFILNNSQYLSQTIEDFKNFFKQDKDKQLFSIKDSISENLALLKDKLKHDNIKVIININDKLEFFGFKNEFQQSILNILNNSIDAFNSKNVKTKRLIIINYEEDSLSIKDSALGIDEKIIHKIFEPYFTTKHQSLGTGIGLYMTQEILTKHMNCSLKVKNCSFEFENEKHNGINFIIKLNQQKDNKNSH